MAESNASYKDVLCTAEDEEPGISFYVRNGVTKMDRGDGEETFGDLTLKIIGEFSECGTDGFWLCTCGAQVLGSYTERLAIISRCLQK